MCNIKLSKISFFFTTFFLFFISSAFFSTPVFALLRESFDIPPLDDTVWQIYQNAGSLRVDGGTLALSAGNTTTFPYIHSKTNPIPLFGDFVVKTRMKYNRVTSKGTGLILAIDIPPNGCTDPLFSDPVFSQRYFLGIWQDSVRNFYFQFCGECYNKECSEEQVIVWKKGGLDLDYHTVEFQYTNSQYSISLDETNIFTSNPTEARPTAVWFGNPSIQGLGDTWTSFEIDYIYINSLPLQPIIFLPGMTACWDGKTLLRGEEGGNWKLPSIAYDLVYQNLIESLISAGLEENKDWYLFCYDWRESLTDNAEKLRNFIKSHVDPPGKVNLIGHSMGGLISRAYVQSHPGDVGRLVIIGSPHQGAVRAYPAWEGGQFWGYEGWDRLLLELFLLTNKKPGEHPMHTIRRVVPSIRDLLPTFDFLVDQKSGDYKNIAIHIHQNETMNELNSALTPEMKTKMGLIYGNGQETLDAIKVTSIYSPHANWVHQKLGLWEDGEPVHTCPSVLCEYTDRNKDYSPSMIYSNEGDETVLAKSAYINDKVQTYEIFTDHSGLVKNQLSIQWMFDFLGIEGSPSVSPLLILNKAIAFFIRSPAEITVRAPDGKEAGYNPSAPEIENSFYDEEANFLLIPNPITGDYQVKISGIGEGNYTLLIAKFDEEEKVEFNEYQFPTNEGEFDIFSINLAEPPLELEDPDGLLFLESAKTKIQDEPELVCRKRMISLFLNRTENLIQKGNYKAASRLIQILLWLLNRCLFNLDDEQLLSLLPKYESMVDDLVNVYLICATKGNLNYKPERIEKILSFKAILLERQDRKFQKMAEKGKEIPLIKVLLFQKTANLLQEAKEALDNGELARASILEFQVEFFLSKLTQ